MDKLEKLKEAIDFINEWGIDDDNYIAKNIKNFMNVHNDADDNSCELANEHYEQLQIIIKAGLNTNQLINSVKEEHTKNLNDLQKKIYNVFIQCFEGESLNIDKFLLWLVKRVNVEQSIFLHNHNQIKAIGDSKE